MECAKYGAEQSQASTLIRQQRWDQTIQAEWVKNLNIDQYKVTDTNRSFRGLPQASTSKGNPVSGTTLDAV